MAKVPSYQTELNFFIFTIIACIVLINLMIGLTVNDFQSRYTSITETSGVCRIFREGDVTPNFSWQLATSSLKNAVALETRYSHKYYVGLS
ncbi:uncharacterized protein [Cardiocondyla obscurior]|uniref:uncharacterized protein n=1 Tax=Cardiocondyla obscurior TaxID=286306 RepID=UPI00396587B9